MEPGPFVQLDRKHGEDLIDLHSARGQVLSTQEEHPVITAIIKRPAEQ